MFGVSPLGQNLIVVVYQYLLLMAQYRDRLLGSALDSCPVATVTHRAGT